MKTQRTSKTEKNILNCSYEQGLFHKFVFRQAQNLHKFLTRKSGNFYLKPNDIISHRPTLFGYHEPHLEALFAALAKTHHEFLIDIGANIGMTSALVGHDFKHIECVEPNKIVAKILEVNIELSGLADRTHIHKIGLGKDNTTEALHIPLANFGGAYIPSGNAYNDAPEMKHRQTEAVSIQEIEIVKAETWIKQIFDAHPDWKNGVIKIDVEGFEMFIFDALLKRIPKGVSVVVVMENFLTNADFDRFQSKHHDLEWFGFYKKKSILKSLPFKLLGMSSYYKQIVKRLDDERKAPHDVIIHFKPK